MFKDILIEIPDEKLSKLLELYQKRAQWAPYMISFVDTAIKWKKSEKYKNSLMIYSPNNSWEQDGTIIAIFKLVSQDFIVFTLDDTCKNLYEGLSKTKLISFENDRNLFFGVHEKMVPTVKKFLNEQQIKISEELLYNIYKLSLQSAKNLDITCPSDFYISRLNISNVKQINQKWSLNFKNSEQYLNVFVEQTGGWGIFEKNSNFLVAWALKHSWGHLGLVQVEDNYKINGFGSLATKVLAKKIAEKNFVPTALIQQSNYQSIKMAKKIGFSQIGTCSYIFVHNIVRKLHYIKL